MDGDAARPFSVLPQRDALGVAPTRLLIDNDWVEPADGARFDQVHPATNEVVTGIADAGAADVDRAVRAARRAFDQGPWPRLKARERRIAVQRIVDVVARHADELARLQTLDNGMPLNFSLNSRASARQAADIFDHYAGWIDKIDGTVHPQFTDGAALQMLTFREPVGVVAALIAWNAPLMMFANKVAPALACGCTVVLKPSEYASLTALRLAELIRSVDLPPGVFNIVTGGPKTGEALVTHPGVDKITFTGSRATGGRIATAVGKDIKRVTLELGGKSAALVFPDCAGVAQAGAAVMGLCSTFLSGQVCSTTTRAVVHRSIYDAFVAAARAQVAAVRFGDPFDLATTSAPLISTAQLAKVMGYIDRGRAEGARLVFGGDRPGGALARGNWVNPTLFADVDNRMAIAQEEIFGPVLAVIPFETEEEAIAIANDSAYGLSGGLYTTNLARAFRVARAMRTGSIGINGYSVMPNAPAGGVKGSGMGREGGWASIEAFTELKTVIVNLAV